MCLISLYWAPETPCPLIIAANRDEYYQRHSQPAQFWNDIPEVFAGRDLTAMGGWLGINNKSGHLAIITNYLENNKRRYNTSRGELVKDFLQSSQPAGTWAEKLKQQYRQYAGFNLLLGDTTGLYYISNREGNLHTLSPGLHGFSNGLWKSNWPKVNRLNNALIDIIKQTSSESKKNRAKAIIKALQDDQPVPEQQIPHTGIGIEMERKLAPCFIATPEYGTCVSTVIIAGTDTLYWYEQHYASKGKRTDAYEHEVPMLSQIANR